MSEAKDEIEKTNTVFLFAIVGDMIMNKRIMLSSAEQNGTEMSYIREAFETNWITATGPNVDAFEREVADLVGVEHAAALSSGTAALHLALKTLGVQPGDKVFCSDVTFAASCNPIVYENAIPVFIDSEPHSWNICPKALEKAFDKYPNVKAVVVVHLYGTPAKLDEIIEICNSHKVPVLEDAAESLGSRYKGQQTGSFGEVGVLSFNGNKIITTSSGGMLLSDDIEKVKKARFWSTQARDPARHYQHSELGYNYRLSNICAGVGRGQLNTLNSRISKKTSIYKMYKEAFAGIDCIRMNPIPDYCTPNHWLSCMTLEEGSPVTAIEIIECLEEENIESRPIWKPMSMQPFYSANDFIFASDTPIGRDLFARGLCLPSDTKMTLDEQSRVCDLIVGLF